MFFPLHYLDTLLPTSPCPASHFRCRHPHQFWFCFMAERSWLSFWLCINCSVRTQMSTKFFLLPYKCLILTSYLTFLCTSSLFVPASGSVLPSSAPLRFTLMSTTNSGPNFNITEADMAEINRLMLLLVLTTSSILCLVPPE